MFASSRIQYPCLATAICSLLTVHIASAAIIDSTANPSSTQGWNTASIWGGSAPTSGNDYRVSTGLMSSVTPSIVNGTSWTATGQIRDVSDSNTTTRSTSTTFGGDSLIVPANTRILGKATGGSTQTVNLVLDGGFYQQGPTGETTALSTLAGNITFGSSNIGALAMNAGSNGNFTWIINSTITGDAGDTLQLSMGNSAANAARVNVLNLTGNLSSFAGTLYLGVATGGTNGDGGTGAGSSFSISSDAFLANVQLDTTTNNFLYNLGSGNVTFGSLSLGNGTGTPLGGGVYDMATLNSLSGGSFFTGAGTITVVPEPTTTALGAIALVGAVLVLRIRRHRKTA